MVRRYATWGRERRQQKNFRKTLPSAGKKITKRKQQTVGFYLLDLTNSVLVSIVSVASHISCLLSIYTYNTLQSRALLGTISREKGTNEWTEPYEHHHAIQWCSWKSSGREEEASEEKEKRSSCSISGISSGYGISRNRQHRNR